MFSLFLYLRVLFSVGLTRGPPVRPLVLPMIVVARAKENDPDHDAKVRQQQYEYLV